MRRRVPVVWLPVFLACLALHVSVAMAQYGGGTGYSLGPLVLIGSVGFSSEAYTASGIAGRRPPASGRIFANAAASALGMSYSIDANLSTEGSELRQSMSQLGVSVSYEWIHVAAGDVRPSLSRFSVEGINVTGGLVELTPGKFLLTAVAGRSQRAVHPDSADPFRKLAFDRSLYALKAGYGTTSDGFVHIVGMFSRDDPGSLPGTDMIAPQENFNASTVFGSKFLDKRISVEGTLTLSTLSEDNRQEEIEGMSTPSIFLPFIKERAGNKTDYAGRIIAQYSERDYGLQASYERVQPGFTSLGLSTTRADQEQFSLRPQVTFWDRKARVSVEYSQSRNNLLKNLSSTNTRRQFGVMSMTRVSPMLAVNASYRLLTYDIVPQAGSSTAGLSQNSHILTLVPTLTWLDDKTSHTVSLTTNYQTSSVEGTSAGVSGNTNFTGSTLYSVSFPEGLTLHSTGNLLVGEAGPTSNRSVGIVVGASRPFFERQLTLGLSLGATQNTSRTTAAGVQRGSSNTQLTMNLNAAYRLWFGDTVRLGVRGLSSSLGGGRKFQELQANLELTHQL